MLYSSESNLFVHFSTLQRTANTQNRGFKGIFEFSESFVKLDFIRELIIWRDVMIERDENIPRGLELWK